MTKSRVLTVALSVAVLFTLATSVTADPVRVPPGQVKFNLAEVQVLDVLDDIGKADIRSLLSDHFANNNGNHFGFRNLLPELAVNGRRVGSTDGGLSNPFANNNGRHLGFSVDANRGGLGLGLTNSHKPNTSVTQNPEPTGMLLLGTGLAAGAAFLRRRTRKRRSTNER